MHREPQHRDPWVAFAILVSSANLRLGSTMQRRMRHPKALAL